MKTTKLISIFLAVFALLPIFSSCGNREHRSETTASSEPISEGVSSGMTENNDDKSPKWAEYGLQTADDGTVMLGGEAYTGMGVNFFDPMNVMSIIGEEKLEEYFKGLSEGNIPYIRMKFGFFYSYELSSYYSPAKKIIFFKNLDKIVRMAEKHNVGIIASLIWNSNIFPEYFNETLDMNADPESKSVKEAIKYVIEIVNRYKESPAIWAWR